MKKIFSKLICLGVIAVVASCSSQKTNSSTYETNYSLGTFKSDLPYSLEQIHSASMVAVKQLNTRLVENSIDAMTASIIASDIQNDLIRITIRKYAGYKTNLKIIVGNLGNKRKSQLVFNQIIENLKKCSTE